MLSADRYDLPGSGMACGGGGRDVRSRELSFAASGAAVLYLGIRATAA